MFLVLTVRTLSSRKTSNVARAEVTTISRKIIYGSWGALLNETEHLFSRINLRHTNESTKRLGILYTGHPELKTGTRLSLVFPVIEGRLGRGLLTLSTPTAMCTTTHKLSPTDTSYFLPAPYTKRASTPANPGTLNASQPYVTV